MRRLSFYLIMVLFYIGCKPKDNSRNVTDLLTKDSTKNEIKIEKKGSPTDLIIGKWKMKESSPEPTSEEEKTEMINTVIEFTRDGKVLVTSKGETKEEASYTLSMDNKYMLSTESGKDNTDSLFIEDINNDRLVLSSTKEKRRIVLAPAR